MPSFCSRDEPNGSYYCRQWHLFVLPSLLIYVGGLLFLLICSAVSWLNEKFRWIATPKRHYCVASSLYDFAFGCNTAGQRLMIAIFIMSLASFTFYMLDVARPETNEFVNVTVIGKSWTPGTVQLVDFSMNMAFAAHFILRGIAASNKLDFWLSWKTFVDVATIPNSVTFMYYKNFWTGLRFIRAFYIHFISDLLQNAGVLRDTAATRLTRIFFAFYTLLIVAAGFIHMFENNGDPWVPDFNGQKLSYFECIYFLVVTLTTIGYGDIVCKTSLGRYFNISFVCLGLVLFANTLPEVRTIAIYASTYNGHLRLPIGRRHIIVLGHVTEESATKFVEAFLHPDRESRNIAVVLLHPDYPSISIEALLKRFKNARYFMGNQMKVADLTRVRLAGADACVILANELARDPDEEDSANIMRAIAIKNFNGHTRVLIQLIRERNKAHLLNIPSWNSIDGVVCLEEFKMGAMAQNCWAPGFATLMSLLLTAYSADTEPDAQNDNDLDDLDKMYTQGAGYEIYGTVVSPDFIGMKFTEAVELCFKRLRLVLVAIKTSAGRAEVGSLGPNKVLLNPGRLYILQAGDQGFFLAHSADDVARAKYFCKVCHTVRVPLSAIKKCACHSKHDIEHEMESELLEVVVHHAEKGYSSSRLLTLLNNVKHSHAEADSDANGSDVDSGQKTTDCSIIANDCTSSSRLMPRRGLEPDDVQEKFDYTGMFYWRPRRQIAEVVIRTLKEAVEKDFSSHVIVCVFAEPDAPLIGLRNFVMPLRSSNRLPAELKPIVFVGNLRYLEREWEQIDTFPGIYIVPGSAMDRNILRSINVNSCEICVIFSAKLPVDNLALMDKYAILCYLNIKTMKFDLESHLDGSQYSASVALTSSTEPTTSKASKSRAHANGARHTTALNQKLSIGSKIVNSIAVITEIAIPENILFLDEDMKHTSSTPLVKMYPFACGSTFAGDVLNSAISVAFYNPDALTLTRELVTGGSTTESDHIFAEGLGFCEGTDNETIKAKRNRARIHQFSLSHPRYCKFATNGCTYAELFVGILRQFSYVCLCVCRIRGNEEEEQRIVIVSPPDKFRLKLSDKFICLQPFDDFCMTEQPACSAY